MALQKATKGPGTQTQLRHSPSHRELGADGELVSDVVGLNRERDLERLDCRGSSETLFKSRRNGSKRD